MIAFPSYFPGTSDCCDAPDWTRQRVRRALRVLWALGTVSFSSGAWADEPYVTDEAAILERGTCQVQAGKRTLRGSREWYLLPACNLIADVEITVGRSGSSGPGDEHNIDNVVHAKGVWRALEPNRFGYGWAVGGEFRRHPREGERRGHDYFGTLLGSRSFFDDRLIVHANLGGRWLRDENRGALTGAILVELALTERLAVLAETYDSSRSRRARQAGVRFDVVPEHVMLHFTVGGDARDFNATRSWAMGMQFVAPVLNR